MGTCASCWCLREAAETLTWQEGCDITWRGMYPSGVVSPSVVFMCNSRCALHSNKCFCGTSMLSSELKARSQKLVKEQLQQAERTRRKAEAERVAKERQQRRIAEAEEQARLLRLAALERAEQACCMATQTTPSPHHPRGGYWLSRAVVKICGATTCVRP